MQILRGTDAKWCGGKKKCFRICLEFSFLKSMNVLKQAGASKYFVLPVHYYFYYIMIHLFNLKSCLTNNNIFVLFFVNKVWFCPAMN